MSQVLVLEDERTLRQAICRDLSRKLAGLDVTGAGALKEAVELLGGRAPAVVVADLLLPDGTGLELLPELALRGLNVPVIFITGHYERFAQELPRSANIDVLQKPFDNDRLCELVQLRIDRQKTQPPPASAFTVADYLQLAAMARRSVALTISDAAGRRGRIVMQTGEVCWAGDEHGAGVDAFRRLAMLASAEVSVHPCAGLDTAPNLSGGLDGLLLDAARAADEAQRDGSSTRNEVSGSSPPRGKALPPPPPSAALSAQPPNAAAVPARRPVNGKPERPVSAFAGKPAPQAGAPAEPDSPVTKQMTAKVGTPPESKESASMPANKTKSAARLKEVLERVPTLRALATSAPDGSVLEMVGEMDGETACAVAVLASKQIDSALQELGLGELKSWTLTTSSHSWYVVQQPSENVVAVGDTHKNAIANLKKLESECGG